jgi:membrane protein YdbS with pleckstrin-like domain
MKNLMMKSTKSYQTEPFDNKDALICVVIFFLLSIISILKWFFEYWAFSFGYLFGNLVVAVVLTFLIKIIFRTKKKWPYIEVEA